MAGTKAGGKKAAMTNLSRHGDSFYKDIGKMGGVKGCTGGFYGRPDLASKAGEKGGRISRRKPSQQVRTADFNNTDKIHLRRVEQ